MSDLEIHICPIHLFGCPIILELSDNTEINSLIDMDEIDSINKDVEKIEMDNEGL